jgi:hypothetical protein
VTSPAIEHPSPGIRVVLLAGPGESTDIVANALASRVEDLVVVLEDPASRFSMARRRARRLGWSTAVGQVLFVTVVLPLLRRQSVDRQADIVKASGLDPTSVTPSYRVPSVNDDRVADILTSLQPDLIVVNGTRIIAGHMLEVAGCPIINLHAGITPRYRGVHGGYWALVEGHPEWVGSTVHLVDPGIDTGGILGQSAFRVTDSDSFATYPTLHIAAGIPLLQVQLDRVLAGVPLEADQQPLAPGSQLFSHPTVWGYLWCRWRRGIR